MYLSSLDLLNSMCYRLHIKNVCNTGTVIVLVVVVTESIALLLRLYSYIERANMLSFFTLQEKISRRTSFLPAIALSASPGTIEYTFDNGQKCDFPSCSLVPCTDTSDQC